MKSRGFSTSSPGPRVELNLDYPAEHVAKYRAAAERPGLKLLPEPLPPPTPPTSLRRGGTGSRITLSCESSFSQRRDDRVGIIDAAAPGAAADGLQGRP